MLGKVIKKTTFVFVLLCLLIPVYSYDAMALAISINKPRIETNAAPGTTESGVIGVRNKGKLPLNVKTAIEDWVFDEKRQLKFKPPGSTPLSCANWIDVNPKRLFIPPGETREFNYNITVPPDVRAGHYAVIFFSSTVVKDEEQAGGMGIKFVGRIGALVFHETEGTIKKGSFSFFKIIKPERNKPLLLRYKFKNEGNAYVKFRSHLSIIGKDGSLYGNVESEGFRGTLPGDVVEDTIKWFGSLSKGTYDVILTIDMGKDVAPLVREESITIEQDIM